MAINVEVKQNKNENAMSIIKRFTRKMQESGVLQKARSGRFMEREKSPMVKRKQKLHSLERKTEIEKLIKLGKMQERRPRRR